MCCLRAYLHQVPQFASPESLFPHLVICTLLPPNASAAFEHGSWSCFVTSKTRSLTVQPKARIYLQALMYSEAFFCQPCLLCTRTLEVSQGV